MLSLRITATPLTLKRSPSSYQYSPYSPFAKRATFIVNASNLPAGGRLSPVAICHNEVNSQTTDNGQRPFSTRSHPDFNDDGCTGKNDPSPTRPSRLAHNNSSVFPVYGPFELFCCLQTGGFGSAWAARDCSTGRLLCLKVFQSVQRPDVRRSVRTELRAFKRLVKSKAGEKGKQFIMELNRSIQHDNDVLFAMELMIADLGTYFIFEPERCKLNARRWMAQIALGIQSLHEMRIIHRDIKTENILIDSRENIRIIDFGLAYLSHYGKPLRTTEFLGTPPYMAPEVLQNKRFSTYQRAYYGEEIDWWALGCVLFELESQGHQILFDTENDVDAYVTWIQESGETEKPHPAFDDLDPIVVNLLQGLLQVEPSPRYALNDLEEHDYFLRPDGTSEFDNTAARALERPILPDLVPQFSEDRQPMRVVDAAKLASSHDWTNLKWAFADM